tara:strand:- start:4433 stop:4582 length:150 start_codon:yes stop_codon:yes gene_type:complete
LIKTVDPTGFKKIKYYKYRNIFITIIVIMFILTWAELGVGLFGTPFAGN